MKARVGELFFAEKILRKVSLPFAELIKFDRYS